MDRIATSTPKVEHPIWPIYSAKMQTHDWNDLKYLLALHRRGKLTHAGRSLRVSDTTVARRLKALEQSLGTKLFLRGPNGRYEPTDAALQILKHAEVIEAANAAIETVSGQGTDDLNGSVRISSVPIIVNHFILPHLAALTRLHPQLSIELVPTSGNLDLSKREADLAVRFARPSAGGLRIRAQKLGELAFAVYTACFIPPDQISDLSWITYDEAHGDLSQARWLEAAAKSSDLCANLKVSDAETGMQAAAEGIGKTLLPKTIASRDPRLQEVPFAGKAGYPTREVWMLSHGDQVSRASIKAAKDWLTGLEWV